MQIRRVLWVTGGQGLKDRAEVGYRIKNADGEVIHEGAAVVEGTYTRGEYGWRAIDHPGAPVLPAGTFTFEYDPVPEGVYRV